MHLKGYNHCNGHLEFSSLGFFRLHVVCDLVLWFSYHVQSCFTNLAYVSVIVFGMNEAEEDVTCCIGLTTQTRVGLCSKTYIMPGAYFHMILQKDSKQPHCILKHWNPEVRLRITCTTGVFISAGVRIV
jgi:hypothetical protein